LSEPATADWTGRVALVSGAGRNIGRAIALALARQGAAVVLAGRDETRLRRTLEASAAPERVLAHAGDLAQDGSAETLVARALERFGRIDAVACLAGGGGGDHALLVQAPTEWERIVRDNLFSSMRLARAALPALCASRGTLLFTSGGGAWFPETNARHTAYATAKAALCRLTDQLAHELLASSVRVNCLQPGLVLNAEDLARVESEERALGAPHALRAANHTPEQAAELALWLLGPASAPLSGRLVATDDAWWRATTRAQLERIQADPHAYTLRRMTP
jgi:NAD(P)-dependent dehydrogenase (short-subunit alcohol dehydrogenase family)